MAFWMAQRNATSLPAVGFATTTAGRRLVPAQRTPNQSNAEDTKFDFKNSFRRILGWMQEGALLAYNSFP